jgi:tripartite-type tricarboxylate transporter receptor subunit TctC
VRIIVGFPSGGPSDIVARLIGQWLSERLGQPFIIENRPGATGNIGTEAVTRAPADGALWGICRSPLKQKRADRGRPARLQARR